ncbi:hypothetical protein [Aquimarina agarivorans]|uniref:hypothetical protein n=1 Tax=Aquimarina agarivorans TaxID=980584 RepID=UPI000248E90B|nr:hypothetical protein [Aquimarina agarivorans]
MICKLLKRKSIRLQEKEFQKNGLTIIEESQSYGFVREIYYSDSNFSEIKLFYSSGNVKEKGIYFNNGSQYGIWYKFDEKGKLIQEINTDEGYDFGWKEIIAYCEQKEIELTKVYVKGGYQTEILKQEENGRKVWVISYLVSPVLICKETLDGVTGKLLNSEELEFINH